MVSVRVQWLSSTTSAMIETTFNGNNARVNGQNRDISTNTYSTTCTHVIPIQLCNGTRAHTHHRMYCVRISKWAYKIQCYVCCCVCSEPIAQSLPAADGNAQFALLSEVWFCENDYRMFWIFCAWYFFFFFVSPLSMPSVVVVMCVVIVSRRSCCRWYILDQPVSSLFKPCQHSSDKKHFVFYHTRTYICT